MLALLIAASLPAANEPPALRQVLEPLGFLVGYCWEGEFPASGERDVHCFDSVYEGQHVRDRHQVTGGTRVYRGETIYSSVPEGAVTYTYWNSLGGVSRGTMRPRADGLDFGDESYRAPDGRSMTISTHWRRVGEDSYEAVTVAPGSPAMNRTVRYRRLPPVSVSASQDPAVGHVLVHETIVDAPADAVWAAISTAEGWRSWAVPAAWTSPAEPDVLETSYTPTARPGDRSTIKQSFVARIPGRLLAFRTIKAPEGFPHFETYGQVTSLFEIEPVGERRTRVRLTGAGYADTQAGRQLLGFFREGNRVSLERLRQRFATGPLDWNAVLNTSRE